MAKFSSGLGRPHWLYVLPSGDVLVAETNAPPKPEDGKGIKLPFCTYYCCYELRPGSAGQKKQVAA